MPDIKSGDTVAWADVPDGAMVRDEAQDYILRWGGQAEWVNAREFQRPGPVWHAAALAFDADAPVTIIALGLSGSESAEDLQRMAEIFDGWRDLCERTGWDREMAWGNAVALHGFGWRAGLPFVADLARAASDPCAACAEMDGWGCREHQSAAEDRSKPPQGYEVEQDAGDPEGGAWGSYLRLEGETIWESAWLRERADALAAAWAHHDARAATKEQP